MLSFVDGKHVYTSKLQVSGFMDSLLNYNQDFVTFSVQHQIILILLGIGAVLIPGLSRRFLNSKDQWNLARLLAILISLTVLIWTAIRYYLGDFDLQTDLPLDICNMTALLLPIYFWKPRFVVFEVLVFWVLFGTMIALFTPHLINGFPNFTFFKYWIVHGGLVIFMVYVSAVRSWRPKRKSVWRSFLFLQVYVLFVLVFNLLIGANYVYLLGKPPTASPLDFLGPWPWYLILVEALALGFFYLIYRFYPKFRANPTNR